MREIFVVCSPLVTLPKISCKHARVEDELVCIVDNLLGGVGRGSIVSERDCVIDMTPDNLDGVGGIVCLTEVLVVYRPVCIRIYGVCLV